MDKEVPIGTIASLFVASPFVLLCTLPYSGNPANLFLMRSSISASLPLPSNYRVVISPSRPLISWEVVPVGLAAVA